jgi:hypothetical protein
MSNITKFPENKSPALALAEHAIAIRSLGKQTLANVIEIGRHLVEAKAEAKKLDEPFSSWLDREFEWTYRTALNFIRVYELASKSENFSDLKLPVSAIYQLAAPSTPKEACDQIVERAQAGEISFREVERVIKAAKGSKPRAKTPNPVGSTKPDPADCDLAAIAGTLSRLSDSALAQVFELLGREKFERAIPRPWAKKLANYLDAMLAVERKRRHHDQYLSVAGGTAEAPKTTH